MHDPEVYDAIVVGGGPAGATAAQELAAAGRKTMLLDRPGRIKPCGGAIPPRLIRDFDIPERLLASRATSARIVSPSMREVDMPIERGYVGMVDRGVFDEWLRQRAASFGAERRSGAFERIDREPDGMSAVVFRPHDSDSGRIVVRTRAVIGADGATSLVARQALRPGRRRNVFAYHEIIRSPLQTDRAFDPARCEIHYRGDLSPDFYAWIFPHGETASVGVGSAQKGFSLRSAVRRLRNSTGLSACETLRCEGAPLPLQPLKRWDDGRGVVLAGDAAGVVAPASGEGIYYAMVGGRLAAESVDEFLAARDPRALSLARKRFMKSHRLVFMILGMMQYFWYGSDGRRERFVKMCGDPDVQKLTWDAYLNKELVRAGPRAHMRIFFNDLGHLLGVAKT